MILDLERVEESTQVAADEVFEFDDVSGEKNKIACHVDATVRRIGETFYIDGSVSGGYETLCHKCLEPVRVELSPPFSVVVKRASERSEVEGVGEAGDYVELPAGQREFELGDHIYEHLIVSIPITVACREDCQGLCSNCGQNLNKGKCDCESVVDSRWDALKKLKRRESDESV